MWKSLKKFPEWVVIFPKFTVNQDKLSPKIKELVIINKVKIFLKLWVGSRSRIISFKKAVHFTLGLSLHQKWSD